MNKDKMGGRSDQAIKRRTVALTQAPKAEKLLRMG